MRIGITSGYANPIHLGHVDCVRLGKELVDQLWYIVNSDYQAFLKRGSQSFQDEQCRLGVVGALRYVDRAILAVDRDLTVCQTLEALIKEAQVEGHEVLFLKGGDRAAHEIPERKICDKYGVKIVDGLGAKTHSSSEYLKRVRE